MIEIGPNLANVLGGALVALVIVVVLYALWRGRP